eukprot:c4036_g1_i1.p1 GENE.c4036_g1_i1~~c4036_g1_i1.p1  ORF type:complete len:321 (-),score=82.11 c4036_g1_i1:302-1204(-)
MQAEQLPRHRDENEHPQDWITSPKAFDVWANEISKHLIVSELVTVSMVSKYFRSAMRATRHQALFTVKLKAHDTQLTFMKGISKWPHARVKLILLQFDNNAADPSTHQQMDVVPMELVVIGGRISRLDFICCAKLQKVTVDGLNLGSMESARAIIDLLQSATFLNELVLAGCGLRDDAAESICKALQHHPLLTSLTITNNDHNIVFDITKLLSTLPKLTSLNLWYTHLKDFGAFELSEVLPSLSNLTYLNLSRNKIEHQGIAKLALAISELPNLTSLNLKDNEVTSEIHEQLAHIPYKAL